MDTNGKTVTDPAAHQPRKAELDEDVSSNHARSVGGP